MQNNFTVPVKGRKNKKFKKPTVIIIADKHGEQMKTYGPISLLNIGQHCVIDLQITAIRSIFPDSEIILCTGFESDKVIRYIKQKFRKEQIRIVENTRFDQTGCAESVRLSLNNTYSDNILIIPGNIVIYPELIHIHQNSSYALTIPQNKNSNIDIGCLSNEYGNIANISYGIGDIWTDILFLCDAEYIEALNRILSQDSFRKKFFFEAVNELIAKAKYSLKNVQQEYEIIKIANVKSYQRLKFKYETTNTQLFIRNQY